ncbi:fibronectin type III-like domain-contianing protein [Streptomyces sp. NPDC093568]|uniref:fibronectin type III-like domain-contianing protein n=1 Tax=Streptomyces sp. NPDC093568 TaxID=3366041 RepID=UPI003819F497
MQLYTRALAARHRAPRRRLTDFRKVSPAPGERRRLEFDMHVAVLAHWSVSAGAFAVDPGQYEILIGHSAEAIALTAPLTVTGPSVLPARSLIGGRLEAVDFDECVGGTLADATREKGRRSRRQPVPSTADCATARSTWAARQTDRSSSRPRCPARRRTRPSRSTPAAVPVSAPCSSASMSPPAPTAGYDWRTVSAPIPAGVTGVNDLHLVLRGQCPPGRDRRRDAGRTGGTREEGRSAVAFHTY